MAKIIPKKHESNFRITIEPRGLGDYGYASFSPRLFYGDGPEAEKLMQEELMRRCKDIVEQVKRHVDGIGWVGIENDEEQQCPFCNYNWENACDENGAPGCCQAAVDEYERPE
jgi:hypothetical protein